MPPAPLSALHGPLRPLVALVGAPHVQDAAEAAMKSRGSPLPLQCLHVEPSVSLRDLLDAGMAGLAATAPAQGRDDDVPTAWVQDLLTNAPAAMVACVEAEALRGGPEATVGAASILESAASAAASHRVPLVVAVHSDDPLQVLADHDVSLIQSYTRVKPKHVVPLSRHAPSGKGDVLDCALGRAREFYSTVASSLASHAATPTLARRFQLAVLLELGGELKAARMAYEEIWEGALATVDVRNGWQMWAKGLAVAEVAHARRTHCLLSSDDAEEAARCLRAHLRRSRVLSGAVSMPVEARAYLHLWRARQLATAAHAVSLSSPSHATPALFAPSLLADAARAMREARALAAVAGAPSPATPRPVFRTASWTGHLVDTQGNPVPDAAWLGAAAEAVAAEAAPSHCAEAWQDAAGGFRSARLRRRAVAAAAGVAQECVAMVEGGSPSDLASAERHLTAALRLLRLEGWGALLFQTLAVLHRCVLARERARLGVDGAGRDDGKSNGGRWAGPGVTAEAAAAPVLLEMACCEGAGMADREKALASFLADAAAAREPLPVRVLPSSPLSACLAMSGGLARDAAGVPCASLSLACHVPGGLQFAGADSAERVAVLGRERGGGGAGSKGAWAWGGALAGAPVPGLTGAAAGVEATEMRVTVAGTLVDLVWHREDWTSSPSSPAPSTPNAPPAGPCPGPFSLDPLAPDSGGPALSLRPSPHLPALVGHACAVECAVTWGGTPRTQGAPHRAASTPLPILLHVFAAQIVAATAPPTARDRPAPTVEVRGSGGTWEAVAGPLRVSPPASGGAGGQPRREVALRVRGYGAGVVRVEVRATADAGAGAGASAVGEGVEVLGAPWVADGGHHRAPSDTAGALDRQRSMTRSRTVGSDLVAEGDGHGAAGAMAVSGLGGAGLARQGSWLGAGGGAVLATAGVDVPAVEPFEVSWSVSECPGVFSLLASAASPKPGRSALLVPITPGSPPLLTATLLVTARPLEVLGVEAAAPDAPAARPAPRARLALVSPAGPPPGGTLHVGERVACAARVHVMGDAGPEAAGWAGLRVRWRAVDSGDEGAGEVWTSLPAPEAVFEAPAAMVRCDLPGELAMGEPARWRVRVESHASSPSGVTLHVRERPGMMQTGPQVAAEEVPAQGSRTFEWGLVPYECGAVPLPDVSLGLDVPGLPSASLQLPRFLRMRIRPPRSEG